MTRNSRGKMWTLLFRLARDKPLTKIMWDKTGKYRGGISSSHFRNSISQVKKFLIVSSFLHVCHCQWLWWHFLQSDDLSELADNVSTYSGVLLYLVMSRGSFSWLKASRGWMMASLTSRNNKTAQTEIWMKNLVFLTTNTHTTHTERQVSVSLWEQCVVC